jgi:uncharacterized membrane protein YbhN (UPF0104 family)
VRRVHSLLFVAGAVCLAALACHIGAATLWSEMRVLGWGTAAIVSLAAVEQLLHALAWSRCFQREDRPGWLRLYGVHLSGGAINLVTPTATLGGELVRGSLLPSVSAATAVASVAVDRLAYAVADTGLGALGLVVLLVRADLSGWTALGVLAAAALFVT